MDRRWKWYGQVRDAVFAIAALVVLGFALWRDSWNRPIVTVIVALAGVPAVGRVSRHLYEKIKNGET